jgi:hypothetical protein
MQFILERSLQRTKRSPLRRAALAKHMEGKKERGREAKWSVDIKKKEI